MAKATAKAKAAPVKRVKKPLTAKAILTKARKILDDPAHWGKWNFVVAPGKYCLTGACYRAAGISDKQIKMYGRYHKIDRLVEPELENCIAKLYPKKRLRDIIFFNDAPRTTHRQVLRVLDCAIECAK